MPYGKYVEMVIKSDPDYMDWFIYHINEYILDHEAQEELDSLPVIQIMKKALS